MNAPKRETGGGPQRRDAGAGVEEVQAEPRQHVVRDPEQQRDPDLPAAVHGRRRARRQRRCHRYAVQRVRRGGYGGLIDLTARKLEHREQYFDPLGSGSMRPPVDTIFAPEFPGGLPWINSGALTMRGSSDTRS